MKFYKKFGQHILVDRKVIEKIISYAQLKGDESVLEVGCGTGNLTEELLRHSRKVYGIERDPRFVELLGKKFSREIENGRLELIEGDALKVEWPEFDKFVSNIPYSISTDITFKLLKHKFSLAVVMYQKEFARRLVARGGKEYGRLSVMVRAFARVEILDYVKPTSFIPPPEVESAIVRFIPEPEIVVKDLEKLDFLLKKAFSNRRKKFGKIADEIGIKIPEELRNERPEGIPPEVYAELSERL